MTDNPDQPIEQSRLPQLKMTIEQSSQEFGQMTKLPAEGNSNLADQLPIDQQLGTELDKYDEAIDIANNRLLMGRDGYEEYKAEARDDFKVAILALIQKQRAEWERAVRIDELKRIDQAYSWKSIVTYSGFKKWKANREAALQANPEGGTDEN